MSAVVNSMSTKDTTKTAEKRRSRKKIEEPVIQPTTPTNVFSTDPENIQIMVEDEPAGSKKRGRKPRGGKLIIRQTDSETSSTPVANVILHLKCSLNDLTQYNTQMSRLVTDPLKYNPEVPPEIITYNESTATSAFSPIFDNIAQTNAANESANTLCSACLTKKTEDLSKINMQFTSDDSETETINMKDINAKLKMLKIQLYKNALQQDKKSACFWCTYEFDNSPCYIPKFEMDDTIYGYGSFCRPECAVAYLFEETLDDSTKFERYQLLNQIYGKVYNCKKNIKPAPNPYYLLDKFYGNMSIQEYRKLMKSEHLLLVLDKPFTRILPELHEDNDDAVMNIYGIDKPTANVSGVYKVKRQSEKQQGPTKSSIILNKFGLA